MADRIVSIKLMADATGLVQGFNRASDAAQALREKATTAGQRMAQSARENREAWTTVGAGLTTVGVAVTGIGVAALKTGVQYNTLQQTTRAALTTLLGSAQAANAQMDKLDDFARNSPFSKATFITAQQQMLAFGIEAKKVIPYLDGVQNAVAAAGGSNADIEGIVATMSKIQSSSKITATDLMEFGNRGVNAADLIGSQMGKTGAQIREDITAGSLGAEEALDALVAGMSQKFDGAADNVKNTFAGSMDRVKAAWRDFASELAKPLVDPNGGGALVDLLNWTADAMRNFEKLPEPVKNTVSALTGLVGVGSLVAGTFMLALPKFLQFKDALSTLGVTGSTVRGGLKDFVNFLGGPWGIGLLAAAASLHALNAAMDASVTSSQQFTTSIKQGVGAFETMNENAAKSSNWIYDATIAYDDLGGALDQASKYGGDFNRWLNMSFGDRGAIESVKEFGGALASLAADDLPRAQTEFASFGKASELTREQLATALNEMPAFKSSLLDYAEAAGIATDDSSLLKLALGEIEATGPKNSLEELSGVAQDVSDQISKLSDEILNFGKSQIDADRAALGMRDSLRSLDELIAQGAGSLDGYSAANDKTVESLLKVADASRNSAAATLEQTGSQEAANAILDEGRQKIIDSMVALGMDAEAARAWANQRVPTADSVAAALDGVTGSANSIPTESKANVKTDAENATAKLNRVTDSANSIPSSKSTTVTANTASASAGVSGFLDLLGRIPTFLTVGLATAVSGKAHGGTVGYAHGGTVEKAAYGKTIGGIGGGVSGGTVYGRGTAKSDSVLTMLSKGEEVIQEPYASMYRRELKQMNRGDFVPGSQGAPRIIVMQAPAGRELSQNNVINMHDRDPRVVFRQLNREFRGLE